ncbi:putative AP-3 adaptor complex subunit sigma [Aspergillus melleus]|uniref:putative AP-3 adaptor complex subunit sigma n=1 Tax=Aspergillus melleus TaxID=138277 RepID=UPI001E8E05FD|nr:Sigma-adaptin 3A [Aspergillus melleus]KAH8435337.1 Sigma-adaptin 3A [Aspergillus melleus]
MINAVLVFNNAGQPRLTKFYTQIDTQTKQSLIEQIYKLVAQRPASACNFLPLPPLLSQGARSGVENGPSDAPTQITYRTYATLSFIMISTSTESPLALIDLIQVFVEALDRMFENVCELDLIFGYETMHAVLSEMIVGGVVVETNLEKIVAGASESSATAWPANLRQKLPSTKTLHIHDINTETCKKLVAEYSSHGKIEIAPSAKELTSKCHTVLSSLPAGKHVRQVYLDAEHGVITASKDPERLLIECSTIKIESTMEFGKTIIDAGLGTFVDATVSGGVWGANSGSRTRDLDHTSLWLRINGIVDGFVKSPKATRL